MSKFIQAVDEIIIAKVIKKDEVTEGGLLIPASFGENSTHRIGEVISVGQKVTEVKPNDVIIFHIRGGQTFVLGSIETDEYRALKLQEIYGVVKEVKDA